MVLQPLSLAFSGHSRWQLCTTSPALNLTPFASSPRVILSLAHGAFFDLPHLLSCLLSKAGDAILLREGCVAYGYVQEAA